MPDVLSQWWEAILGSGAVASVLAWLGIRTLKRIDALEQGKADRDVIADLVREFKDHAKDTRGSLSKLHEKVDRTNSTMSNLGERVASIEGEMRSERRARRSD